MKDSETVLIEQLRQGDTEALAHYIEARRGPLLAFIDKQLSGAMKSRIEPEDLLQEVSAEALRSINQLDLTERDPFGWLCQIIRRRVVDTHRRLFGAQKRAAGREIPIHAPAGNSEGSQGGIVDLLVASMTTASKHFSRQCREAKLLTALAQLPEDQQEALRLRYIEGLPSKEIATRLGKTDGAIRVMLSRSLGKLQTILEPEMER